MKLFEQIDRADRLLKLISSANTGSPSEVAQLLGISQSSLYALLDELRSRNAPIAYSRSANTYYFEHPIEFEISFSIKELSTNEQKNISAGFATSSFLEWGRLSLCRLWN